MGKAGACLYRGSRFRVFRSVSGRLGFRALGLFGL